MEEKSNILFLGSSHFSMPALISLSLNHHIVGCITIPDTIREKKETIVSKYCKYKEIPIYKYKTLKHFPVEEVPPFDFIVLASYGGYVPQKIIKTAKIASLNIHPSLVPKYRGASPIHSAILNGDTFTGISIISISKEIDAGDIYLQDKIQIMPYENFGDLLMKLGIKGAIMINKVIKEIKLNSLVPRQQKGKPVYTHKIKKENLHLDFNKKAHILFNTVRAFSPYPLAFSYFRNKRLFIHSVSIKKFRIEAGKLKIKDKRLFVGTYDYALEILKVKPAGKRLISARDFINGFQPQREFLL